MTFQISFVLKNSLAQMDTRFSQNRLSLLAVMYFWALCFVPNPISSYSFTPPPPLPHSVWSPLRLSSSRQKLSNLYHRIPTINIRRHQSMCICINCARVTDCAAYHFVETKHEQPHMIENPTFEPRNGSPTIEVNIRPPALGTNNSLRDLKRLNDAAHDADGNRIDGATEDLELPTVVSVTPQSTIEYDVVGCADYVESPGMWIRNMPEEIRRENPSFVPT